MRIAICDDEVNFVQTIHQYLWNDSNYTIETFFNPDDILRQYKKGNRYDVIFCDIVMKPYNGIELAKKIRKYDQDVILVYLTAYLDYAPQGYEVNAFRYLLKPIQKNALLSLMESIRREQKKQKKLFIETSVGSILVKEDTIVYMEAHDKETLVFCEKDIFYAKMGLSELENLLSNSHFFRIHRKYLVHLDHVLEYDDSKLTTDNKKTLPISRRRSKEFCYAIERFMRGIHT